MPTFLGVHFFLRECTWSYQTKSGVVLLCW